MRVPTIVGIAWIPAVLAIGYTQTVDVERYYETCQEALIGGIAFGRFPSGSTINLDQCRKNASRLDAENSSVMTGSWIVAIIGSVFFFATSYVRNMREESARQQARMLRDLKESKSQANQNTKQIVDEVKRQSRMEIIMGDKFENIAHSTIVNRSHLSRSMTQLEGTNPELSKALGDLAALVAQSGNPSAGKNLDALNQELVSEKPDKHLLSTYWEGLQKIVPTIKSAIDVVSSVSKYIEKL